MCRYKLESRTSRPATTTACSKTQVIILRLHPALLTHVHRALVITSLHIPPTNVSTTRTYNPIFLLLLRTSLQIIQWSKKLPHPLPYAQGKISSNRSRYFHGKLEYVNHMKPAEGTCNKNGTTSNDSDKKRQKSDNEPDVEHRDRRLL